MARHGRAEGDLKARFLPRDDRNRDLGGHRPGGGIGKNLFQGVAEDHAPRVGLLIVHSLLPSLTLSIMCCGASSVRALARWRRRKVYSPVTLTARRGAPRRAHRAARSGAGGGGAQGSG